MTDKTEFDTAVKWCIVGLVMGIVVGGAFGMDYGEKTAPKKEYTIYRNGTLEVYEWIAISTTFPENMDNVYIAESEEYAVFLWTVGYPWDEINNLHLKLKVLEK